MLSLVGRVRRSESRLGFFVFVSSDLYNIFSFYHFIILVYIYICIKYKG